MTGLHAERSLPRSARFKGVLAALVAAVVAYGCSSSTTPEPLPPNTSGWWRDKVVYEIFVRSFADSDGDGVGDLQGLTAHLDYLNDGDPSTNTDLGVDAVWLTPIHPSPSYHGYDVTDYRSVNPAFGTLTDFDAFVAGAHQRGIKVILDMVLNHSSRQHPWFVNSQTGDTAAKRNWYVWSATDPGWRSPFSGGKVWYPLNGAYYYGLFSSTMPDLDLGTAEVEAELVSTMKFWLAHGVDGFRLDAVRHYFESSTGVLVDQPETHAFLKRIRRALQETYPQTLLVGEAWTTVETVATYYGEGDEVQLSFSFDLADAIKSSIPAGDCSAVSSVLTRLDAALAGKDRGFDAPFLSNHDQVRTMRALGADAAAARVAAATLFALPGTPFLYYGEEIGMQGGPATDDRQKRTPFRWNSDAGHGFTSGSPWTDATEAPGVDVATQQADPTSLWNLYRRLLALRHDQSALAKGEVGVPALHDAGPGILALVRTDAGKRVLFVTNFATTPSGPFAVALGGVPDVLLSEGLSAPPAAASGEVGFPGLDARGFAFVSLQ